ncbi:hypothetical protein TNCV_3106441 [Trichonephila clavipes]|nr:hypothetical protein TNCV_3106441 [Trichonephila clavipes]
MSVAIQKFFIRRAWLTQSGCKFFPRKEKNLQKSGWIRSSETESIYLREEKATFCGLQSSRSKGLGWPRALSKNLDSRRLVTRKTRLTGWNVEV